MSAGVEAVVAALSGGELAVVPTDTVYGLAATADGPSPARRLYEAKGRAPSQPTALVAGSVEEILERVPEARGLAAALRALLPGPFTVVLPNPAQRFAWLCGSRPDAIGVRVPAVSGVAHELLSRAGPLVATSANLPGGPDPRSLADVPPEIVAAAAATLDGGELPGTPSTVVDLTGPGPEPRVLREGAVPAAATLARLRAAARA